MMIWSSEWHTYCILLQLSPNSSSQHISCLWYTTISTCFCFHITFLQFLIQYIVYIYTYMYIHSRLVFLFVYIWLLLSEEQMSKRWPCFLHNDEPSQLGRPWRPPRQWQMQRMRMERPSWRLVEGHMMELRDLSRKQTVCIKKHL